jgi:tRNA pseudouridine55 synthase
LKGGVLNLDKPAGVTSHDAVARIRRLFGTRQVGHAGTLDPNATGVLPVLVGSAVKASEFLTAGNKTYRARIRFGRTTDTEDIWGKTTEENGVLPDPEAFSGAVRSFPRAYFQVPPMVSALKVGGKKLYEYARAGLSVPREARRVTVEAIEILSFEKEEAEIRVSCSKGTYIRTLVTDLCRAAGVLGVMSALVREKSGAFSIENAVPFETIEALPPEERFSLLCPVERLFEDLPALAPPPFALHLLKNGQAILMKKYFTEDAPCGLARLCENGVFFALGEVFESEDGKKLKRRKAFAD